MKTDKNKDEHIKQQQKIIMDKLTEAIRQFGEELQQDKTIASKDKATQLDILLDTLHFLDGYEENVPILNEYWIKKRRKQKFGSLEDLEK